eukprot:TRINITY_DN8501_c0_g1_i2.p1 TRINITY_DN8501_c0_g1~~TRINITY_DN8501_c0_g1_i2.p1  ORF type:complete len:340 (-),score=105.63 TRINITY_DN8501_c0_g1_i2:282-1301(-)
MADQQQAAPPAELQSQVQPQHFVEANQPLEAFPVECPEGEHALQTPWSWWFDKKMKAPAGAILSEADFKANMHRIGTVHSVEQFASYYQHCKKPTELGTDSNLHLMRYNTYPMWEPFPLGGCWLIKVSTKGVKVDDNSHGSPNWMWERLLFSTIGELFADPDMIGVSLSVRPKGVVFSIWNLNESESQSCRFAIGEKIKQIVELPQYATIEYKYHGMSMKDRSSFRNARPYLIVAAETNQASSMQLPPASVPEGQATIETNSTVPNAAAPAWVKPAEAEAEPEAEAEAAPAVEEEEAPPAEVEAAAPVPEETEAPAADEEDKEPAKLSFAEMAKRNQAK